MCARHGVGGVSQWHVRTPSDISNPLPPPKKKKPQRLVISCEADKGCWAPALGARLPLVSAELLLTGLLRQQLQLQPFLLLPATPPPFSRDPPKSPQGFYSPSGGP